MAKYTFDWDKLKTDIKEEQDKKGKSFKDERFWAPDWKGLVKAKKGFFQFRFLPDTEGTPFSKYYSHGFKYRKGTEQKWYINNCASTLGWDPGCPICKKNNEYWDSAYESDKEIAKQRKRRLNFVSNVLVVKDPINPENEGKVFLYRYGIKIYEKIEKLLFPTEADLEDPDFVQFVPFDLYEGADFKLKVKMQGEFPNYDDSEFSRQQPVGNDKAIGEIMKQTHLLSEFTDPKSFPTTEAVVAQIGFLLGESVEGAEADAEPQSQEEETPEEESNPFAGAGPVDESEEEQEEESEEPSEQEQAIESSDDEEADADAQWFANLK